MDFIRSNKLALIEILSSDVDFLLQNVQTGKLCTLREYNYFQNMSKNREKTTIELLDKMMSKRDEHCKEFITMLGKDDIVATFPALKELLNPQENVPRQEVAQSSAADNADTNSDNAYKMNNNPRGLCIIINNMNFQTLKTRHGSSKDAEDLRIVFEWLQFVVEEKTDLSGRDMRMVLDEYAKKDHSAYNALVVCVLSHGREGEVLGVDGEEVSIKQLYKPFTPCPTLVGKPKVFFIQACQGNVRQTGHLLEDGPNQQLEELEEDAAYPVNKLSVPVEADVLIGMSTVEEFASFRHSMTGSIYIQALCKMLKSECQKKEDLQTILTYVGNEVSKGVYKHKKQMPQQKSTLRKKLVLTVD